MANVREAGCVPVATLAGPVEFRGVGLFSGAAVRLVLRAASEAERGVMAKAGGVSAGGAGGGGSGGAGGVGIGVGGGYGVIATVGGVAGALSVLSTERVVARARHTAVGLEGGMVLATTEHVISALAGCGVNECVMEIDGQEMPLLDGSAVEFARAIMAAGVVKRGGIAGGADGADGVGGGSDVNRDGGVRVLRGDRPITIVEGDAEIVYLPPVAGDAPGTLGLRYELDYGAGSPIGPHAAEFVHHHDGSSARAYVAEIAPARTFCTLSEAEAMRASGMFGHLQARDVLVIGPRGPVDTAYRLECEPARHKVLDMLGDLALCGLAIEGRVVGRRSGHGMNHALARSLLGALAGSGGLR